MKMSRFCLFIASVNVVNVRFAYPFGSKTAKKQTRKNQEAVLNFSKAVHELLGFYPLPKPFHHHMREFATTR